MGFGHHQSPPIAILLCYDSYFGPRQRDEINRIISPVIELLDKYPSVCLNLKISGITLSGMLWHNYKFVEKIASLFSQGRLEFLGSGFSNSLLTVFEKTIVSEQIIKHRDYIKSVFDVLPKGFIPPFGCFSKEMFTVLNENDFKYIILDDCYLSPRQVAEFADLIEKKGRKNINGILKNIFMPRKVVSGTGDFTIFQEFTMFSERLKKYVVDGNEKTFFKFLSEAFNAFDFVEKDSLITLKIDINSLLSMFAKTHADLIRIGGFVTTILEWIINSNYAELCLFEKWYNEKNAALREKKEFSVESSGFSRYAGSDIPDIYEKFNSADSSSKYISLINNFSKKVYETQKNFSGLLRADREKLSFMPLIELSKAIGLFYQYSFGRPAELEKNSLHYEILSKAAIHLNYLQDLRIKSKGVYLADINSDLRNEILFINDRVFVLLRQNSEIGSFIHLASGGEAIGEFIVPSDLMRTSGIPESCSGIDTYILASHERDGEKAVKYSYQQSQSLLVGAQFSSNIGEFQVSKGTSLYNNKFETKFIIKNNQVSENSIKWIVRYSFAPDYLSVIRYGRSILGFISSDGQSFEFEKEYQLSGSGIGIINKLNNNYVYVNFSRLVPDVTKTSLNAHSYGLTFTYDLNFKSFEEKSFVINIVYDNCG